MARDVVTYREFCDPLLCGCQIGGYVMPDLSHYPSMIDSVMKWDPAEKAAVVSYMKRPEYLIGASTSSYKKDVFTGETIPFSGDVFEDDSGNVWRDYLAYYVDVYNVGLPDDFIRHALEV